MRKVETLKPLKHFCQTIGELPSSYVETMSYYEMILWFTNYLRNTIIPTINNNALLLEELKVLVINLKEVVDDIEVDIQKELDDLQNLLESQISVLNNGLNARIDNEVDTLNDRIDNIVLDNVNVYNPTNGLIEPVAKVINDIYTANRFYAITCDEYDGLELTASAYDELEISAFDFDNFSKQILIGDEE